MRHVWVIDVLTDLRRFAGEQRLKDLEVALSLAVQIATLELSNGEEPEKCAANTPVR